MATTQKKHSAFGIGLIAFVLAIGVSIGYFQFVYLPFINLKPSVPEEILNPAEVTEVRIISGSATPEQEDNFIPRLVTSELSVNNKIVWINDDEVGHTVTTDDDAVDPWSGRFDSLETIGLVQPGQTFEFLFTHEGEYPYHCVPHPWMTGIVKIGRAKF
ncbi:MAG: plastocyanin/azurin family copper-binding protein [Nitrososphaerales archaeon]